MARVLGQHAAEKHKNNGAPLYEAVSMHELSNEYCRNYRMNIARIIE